MTGKFTIENNIIYFDGDVCGDFTEQNVLSILNTEYDTIQWLKHDIKEIQINCIECDAKQEKEIGQLKLREHDLALELNALVDENECLKSQIKELEEELNGKEEGLKSLFQVLNEKIEESEYDLERSARAGMPTGLMYSEIRLLDEIKELLKKNRLMVEI